MRVRSRPSGRAIEYFARQKVYRTWFGSEGKEDASVRKSFCSIIALHSLLGVLGVLK